MRSSIAILAICCLVSGCAIGHSQRTFTQDRLKLSIENWPGGGKMSMVVTRADNSLVEKARRLRESLFTKTMADSLKDVALYTYGKEDCKDVNIRGFVGGNAEGEHIIVVRRDVETREVLGHEYSHLIHDSCPGVFSSSEIQLVYAQIEKIAPVISSGFTDTYYTPAATRSEKFARIISVAIITNGVGMPASTWRLLKGVVHPDFIRRARRMTAKAN